MKNTILKKVETGDISDEFTGESAELMYPFVGMGMEYVSKNMVMHTGFYSWV